MSNFEKILDIEKDYKSKILKIEKDFEKRLKSGKEEILLKEEIAINEIKKVLNKRLEDQTANFIKEGKNIEEKAKEEAKQVKARANINKAVFFLMEEVENV